MVKVIRLQNFLATLWLLQMFKNIFNGGQWWKMHACVDNVAALRGNWTKENCSTLFAALFAQKDFKCRHFNLSLNILTLKVIFFVRWPLTPKRNFGHLKSCQVIEVKKKKKFCKVRETNTQMPARRSKRKTKLSTFFGLKSLNSLAFECVLPLAFFWNVSSCHAMQYQRLQLSQRQASVMTGTVQNV